MSVKPALNHVDCGRLHAENRGGGDKFILSIHERTAPDGHLLPTRSICIYISDFFNDPNAGAMAEFFSHLADQIMTAGMSGHTSEGADK